MPKYRIIFSIVLALLMLVPTYALAADAPVANVFDIDNNGQIEPLSDGLLTLRYLFGFRGETLINQAVGSDATRTTPSQIETYINDHSSDFDIDGNGKTEPLSDGLLLLRYLFGFRGGALINQAVAADATRKTAAEIETYLSGNSPNEIVLFWPLRGSDGVDWVINNYVDLNLNLSEILDYKGNQNENAKTYDQHSGTDIDVPSFRSMDNDVEILAAADGIVENFTDLNDDRNQCQINCGNWNFVTIRHANNFLTVYGHLKKDSVVVSIGQRVLAGEQIAVVGSSGFSTQPHLHFVVENERGIVLDPFDNKMWNLMPKYDTEFSLMDFNFQKGAISAVSEIIDPRDNILSAQTGDLLGIGLSMAGGTSGDVITFKTIRPDGSELDSFNITFNQNYRHSFWFYNFIVDNSPGKWSFEILLNNISVQRYSFDVR